MPVNYDLVFADTDTLNDVIGDINGLAGLNAAVTATIDTSGGTNKLRIDADSADIDFEIAAFSGDALTGRLGLAEGVPHLSSNLLDSGVSAGRNAERHRRCRATSTSRSEPAWVRSPPSRNCRPRSPAIPIAMGTASVDTNGNITLVASGNNAIESIRRPQRSSSA